jgi:hypothetical protein
MDLASCGCLQLVAPPTDHAMDIEDQAPAPASLPSPTAGSCSGKTRTTATATRSPALLRFALTLKLWAITFRISRVLWVCLSLARFFFIPVCVCTLSLTKGADHGFLC